MDANTVYELSHVVEQLQRIADALEENNERLERIENLTERERVAEQKIAAANELMRRWTIAQE